MPLYPKQEPPYYTEQDNAAGTKQYIALLTQEGTAAPTTLILYNTLGNIVWTRGGVGSYTGTLTGEITIDKTVIIMQQDANNTKFGAINNDDGNTIEVTSRNAGTLADEYLYKTAIQITVYP